MPIRRRKGFRPRPISLQEAERLVGTKLYLAMMRKLEVTPKASKKLRHGVIVILRRTKAAITAFVHAVRFKDFNKVCRRLSNSKPRHVGLTVDCHRRPPMPIRFVSA